MSQECAWNGVHAFVGRAAVDARPGEAAAELSRLRGAAITVECADAGRLGALDDDWRDLTRRADTANVFMDPALLSAAMAAYPERRIVTLLAWFGNGASAVLVGVWAFATGRAPQSILPLPVLSAPAMPNAYSATPVIDRDRVDAVLDAMLTAIADDADLPDIVALEAMGLDTQTMAALTRVITARGSATHLFARSERPQLASPLDGKAYFEQALSSSSRKKLRQHRRRLGEKGDLQSTRVTAPDAVTHAFEDFLALEAAGWKGRQGTALLRDEADARYARGMIAALAARGQAAIYSLVLDGKPASMQVVLRSGRSAFTWKTAYDEALHDFSPGMLLLEDYTNHLLAESDVDVVDSCSFDASGYMAVWQERAALGQLWLDARPGGSVAFSLLARLQAAYLAARARAKSLYRHHLRRTGR